MLTAKDIARAYAELGVKSGDSVLTHSSFKSLGPVENGADTVVQGILQAVGPEGTVIFPTLCQQDWGHVYENWHMDAPSDVGYLTNYFRKLPGARRSDQATHSVAALGKEAEWLTATHGQSGLRYGIFGDTCFSADSPWEKMYAMNTHMVFMGCSFIYCTIKHLAEYRFMEKELARAAQKPHGDALIARVWHYSSWQKRGVWPLLDATYLRAVLEKEGAFHTASCGNATLLHARARDIVDTATRLMEARDEHIMPLVEGAEPCNSMVNWLASIDRD